VVREVEEEEEEEESSIWKRVGKQAVPPAVTCE